MNFDEMRRQFTENINAIIQNKRDDNKSFLNVQEYKNRIALLVKLRNLRFSTM